MQSPKWIGKIAAVVALCLSGFLFANAAQPTVESSRPAVKMTKLRVSAKGITCGDTPHDRCSAWDFIGPSIKNQSCWVESFLGFCLCRPAYYYLRDPIRGCTKLLLSGADGCDDKTAIALCNYYCAP